MDDRGGGLHAIATGECGGRLLIIGVVAVLTLLELVGQEAEVLFDLVLLELHLLFEGNVLGRQFHARLVSEPYFFDQRLVALPQCFGRGDVVDGGRSIVGPAGRHRLHFGVVLAQGVPNVLVPRRWLRPRRRRRWHPKGCVRVTLWTRWLDVELVGTVVSVVAEPELLRTHRFGETRHSRWLGGQRPAIQNVERLRRCRCCYAHRHRRRGAGLLFGGGQTQ